MGNPIIEAIKDARNLVLDVAHDMDRIGDVLRNVQDPLFDATTPDALEEILAKGAINIPFGFAGAARAQGYIGHIYIHQNDLRYRIGSMFGNGIVKPAELDTIQQAFGDEPYVKMLPVKALRALAYVHRPDGVHGLSIEEYLRAFDFHLGCDVLEFFPSGAVDLYSASGFQPNWPTSRSLEALEGGRTHLESEVVVAYRGSGLVDQFVASRMAGKTDRIIDIAQRTVHLERSWN